MSVAMMAGPNDLLWDYTEGAPASSPDSSAAKNGALYFNNKVNDAAGTNNGLKGIKLNSSGYCCFTKAAVAGKLKLSFGPRSGSNASDVEVWNWSGAANAQTKGDTKYATTGQQTEYGTQIVELTAEQNNIYLCRGVNTETALQKIEFIEFVPRNFVDFKIEFRDNPYSVILPEGGELPAGVAVAGTSYNGGQHGVQGGSITVTVDGPVKFTIGACQFSGTPINVKKDGVDYATVNNNAACGEQKPNYNQYVTYTYTGDAGVLTFELAGNTYVPYFFAEATEITPCQVIYKDQNGTKLGTFDTYEGATLSTIPYTESDLPAIGEGNAFRGWFYTSGKKAAEGDIINGNTTIQAKVTPIEEAIIGTVQTYDFASAIFYPEDHETVEANNGAYHDGTHGWYFAADGNIRVKVAGNAIVVVTLCKYSETGDVNVLAGDSVIASCAVEKNVTEDGTELSAQYAGEAGWLTISWTAKQYIHKVVVYNVLDFLEKDEATGYFIVPAGDAASFIMALAQAQSGDKIFLPNGLYDLGETCLTTIGKNNIAIIGQSMEGVIIKNAPDASKESIDKTATLKINKNVSGTYLQDLTIQNALDYYKNDNGRAVCLWDQGTKTVCKNVRMLSYQDTYYSNLVGAVKYFEDCEIHGTVDFICGDGSVYFYGTELVCEQRAKDGGGSDALTASNADASDKGYVFEHCTVRYAEGITGTLPVVSFGRSWNNKPKTVFLNTFLDDSNGALNMVKEASAQKDKIERWTLGGMNVLPELFGEYNSVDKNGNVVSPASNNVTFILGSNEKQMETILTAEQAATYTMGYTLGNWAETASAEATQAVVEKDGYEETGIYLVELLDDGSCSIVTGADLNAEVMLPGVSIRKANARGGFGWKAGEEPSEGIEDIDACNCKAEKIIRDGQVIIVRGEKEYTVFGTEVR